MAAAPEILVNFAVPPDRTRLVAEITVQQEKLGNQFCEINSEHGDYRIEVYPRPDGKPWDLPAESLLRTLNDALRDLTARSLPLTSSSKD